MKRLTQWAPPDCTAFWSLRVDPDYAALIRKGMAKTRKPRTVAFETWKGANGQPVAHLRSGPDIIMWTDSKTRIRSIKRLYEIITTRTPENTRYVELAAPYKPKKKRK